MCKAACMECDCTTIPQRFLMVALRWSQANTVLGCTMKAMAALHI